MFRFALFVCFASFASFAFAQQRVCDGSTCRIVPAVAHAVHHVAQVAVQMPAAIVRQVVVQPVQRVRYATAVRVNYRRECRPRHVGRFYAAVIYR